MDPRIDDADIIIPLDTPPHEVPKFFYESSYFLRHTLADLPSPAMVRAISSEKNGRTRLPPIKFVEQNLLVKYGSTITIAEGQCLWAIRKYLSGIIPVPEVYGWCKDGAQFFIYMELIQGHTLQDKWEYMNTDHKAKICKDLRLILQVLRRFKQDPTDVLLTNDILSGHIGKQPLQDIIFSSSGTNPTSSFPNITLFHNWFTQLGLPADAPIPHVYRHMLPDDMEIVFTHGDLHPSNILVSFSESGDPYIASIIDWHQSGWLPAYWEFCKACYTALIESEWLNFHIPSFLDAHDEHYMWEFFVLRLGV